MDPVQRLFRHAASPRAGLLVLGVLLLTLRALLAQVRAVHHLAAALLLAQHRRTPPRVLVHEVAADADRVINVPLWDTILRCIGDTILRRRKRRGFLLRLGLLRLLRLLLGLRLLLRRRNRMLRDLLGLHRCVEQRDATLMLQQHERLPLLVRRGAEHRHQGLHCECSRHLVRNNTSLY